MSEDDPLTKAMREAQAKKAADTQRFREQRQNSDNRLAQVLPPLKQQVKDALAAIPFFDGGAGESGTTYMRNDSNSAFDRFAIVARKTNPAYQATVIVHVQYDYGSPPSVGIYQFENEGRLTRSSPTIGEKTAPFDVQVKVEQDGSLTLDAAAMTQSLAKAVAALES